MSQQLSVLAYAVPLRCNALVVGITAALGILGGVFLITQNAKNVFGKIVDKRAAKDNDAPVFACNVCCAELQPNDVKSCVTCFVCKKTVCRGAPCTDWHPKTASWVCQLCGTSKQSLANTSSWVAEQMSFNQQKLVYPLRARSEIYIPISDCNDSSMHFESVSQVGVNAAAVTAAQKLKIREYVEEVVAGMLGGSLDKIAVGQLSKSETYLQLFEKYHAKLVNIFIGMENTLCDKALSGADLPAIVNGHHYHNVSASSTNLADSASGNNNNGNADFANVSEARLRQLIESIIAETLHLPNALAMATGYGAVSEIALDTRSKDESALTNGAVGGRRHRTEHYFEPKIYQDLLATAVLNKIVDTQGNGRLLSESTPDLSGPNIDSNYNVENQSTTSGSSLEPHSDCSYSTDTELNVEKADDNSTALLSAGRESVISDYIASHMVPLPDLSTPATESEEDDYASVNSSAVGEGTWEDNWLFKKKRTSTASGCGVGMLVPAPKEDVRAQIGDKTADEVSDLSEMGSDTDDSSLDMLHTNIDPLNDRLLSKHLIGGQNTKIVLDELIENASMISSTALPENEPVYIETKNVHVIDAAPKTEAVNVDIDQMQNQAKQDELTAEAKESTRENHCADLPTSNPLSVPKLVEELLETPTCTGFSTVELFDANPAETDLLSVDDKYSARSPSVIEILAAIALGPMLAVPASEQQAVLTPIELTSLKELSDLALAEINARTPDMGMKALGIIHEELSEDELVHEPITAIDESILALHQNPQRTSDLLAKAVELLNTPDNEEVLEKEIKTKSGSKPEHELSITNSLTTQPEKMPKTPIEPLVVQPEVEPKDENVNQSAASEYISEKVFDETQKGQDNPKEIFIMTEAKVEKEESINVVLQSVTEDSVTSEIQIPGTQGKAGNIDYSVLSETIANESIDEPRVHFDIKETEIPAVLQSANQYTADQPDQEVVEQPEQSIKQQTEVEKQDTPTDAETITAEPAAKSNIIPTKQNGNVTVNNPAAIKSSNQVAIDELTEQTKTIERSTVCKVTKGAPANEPEIVPDIQEKADIVNDPASVESGTQPGVEGPKECPVTGSEVQTQDNSAVPEAITEEPVVESIKVTTKQKANETMVVSAAIKSSVQVAVAELTEQIEIIDSTAVGKIITVPPSNEPEIAPDIQEETETLNDPTSVEREKQLAVDGIKECLVALSDVKTLDISTVAEAITEGLLVESSPVTTYQEGDKITDIPAGTDTSIQVVVDELNEHTETIDSSAVDNMTTEAPANESEIVPDIQERTEIINDPVSVESGTQIAFDNSEVVRAIAKNSIVESIPVHAYQEGNETMDIPAAIENLIQAAAEKLTEQTEVIDKSEVGQVTTDDPDKEPELVPDIQENPETINEVTSVGSATQILIDRPEECSATNNEVKTYDNSTVPHAFTEEPVAESNPVPTIQEGNETIDIPAVIASSIQVAVEEVIEQIETIDSSAVCIVATEAPAYEPEIVPDIQEKPETINDPTSVENGTQIAVAGPEEYPVSQSKAEEQDSSTVAKTFTEKPVVESNLVTTSQEGNEIVDIPARIESSILVAVSELTEHTETINSPEIGKVTTEAPANVSDMVTNILEKTKPITFVESGTQIVVDGPEECTVTQNEAQKQDNSTGAENICEEPDVESILAPTNQEVNESMENPAVIESSIQAAVDKVTKQTETIDSSAVFNITTEVPAIEPEIVQDIQDTTNDPTSDESGTQIAFDGPEESPVAQSDAGKQENSTVSVNICEEPVVESIPAPTHQEVIDSMDIPLAIHNAMQVAVDEEIKQTEIIDSSAVLKAPTEVPANETEIVADIQEKKVCPVIESDAEKQDNSTIAENICEEPIVESIPAPTNQVNESMENPAVIESSIQVATDKAIEQTETIGSSTVFKVSTEVPAIEPEIVPDIQENEECPVTQSDAGKQDNSTVAENICEEPVVESIPAPTQQEVIDSMDIPLVIQNAMQVAVDEEIEQTEIIDSSAVFHIPTEVPAIEPEIVPDIQEKQDNIYDPTSVESETQIAFDGPEECPVIRSDAKKHDNSTVAENICEEPVVESILAPTKQEVNKSMHNTAVIESSIEVAVDKITKQTETIDSTAVFNITTEVPTIEPEEVSDIQEKQETINDQSLDESGTQTAVAGPEECPVTQSDAKKQDNSTIAENICEEPVVESILAPTNQEGNESMENPTVIESIIQAAVDKVTKQTETIDSSAVFNITSEVPAIEPEIVPHIQAKHETITNPTSVESGTQITFDGPEECPVTQSDVEKQYNSTTPESMCEEPVLESIPAPTNQEVNDSMHNPAVIESSVEVAVDKITKQTETIDSTEVFNITTEVPTIEPEEVSDIQENQETINDPSLDESGTKKAFAGPEECPVTQSDSGKQDNSTVPENIFEEPAPTTQEVNESIDSPVLIQNANQVAVDEENAQTETIDSSAVFNITIEVPAIEPEEVSDIQEKQETINGPTSVEIRRQKDVAGPEECPVTQSDAGKPNNSTVAENTCEEPVVELIPEPTNQEVNESMENPAVIESSIEMAVDKITKQTETIVSTAVFNISTEVPTIEPEIVPDIQEKEECPATESDVEKQDSSTTPESICKEPVLESIPAPTNQEVNDSMHKPAVIESSIEVAVEKITKQRETIDSTAVFNITTEVPTIEPEIVPVIQEKEECPVTQSDVEKKDNSITPESICEEPVLESIPEPTNQEVNEPMDNSAVIESSIQVAVDKVTIQTETIDNSAVLIVTTEVLAFDQKIDADIQTKQDNIYDPTSVESETPIAFDGPEECPVTQSDAEKQDNSTVAENISEETVVESIPAPTNQEVNESMENPAVIESSIQVAIDKAIEQTETIGSSPIFKVTTEVLAIEPEIVPDIQENEECPVTQSEAGKQDNSTVAENICEEPVVESIPAPTQQEVIDSIDIPLVIQNAMQVAGDEEIGQTEIIDSSAVLKTPTEVPANEREIVADIQEKEECPVTQSDAGKRDNSAVAENICEEPVVKSIPEPTHQDVNESMHNPAVIESSIEMAVHKITKQTETIDSTAVFNITTEVPAIEPEIVPDIQEKQDNIYDPSSVESETQIAFDGPEECPVIQNDAKKQDNSTVAENICEEPVVESILAPTNQEVNESMENPAVIESSIQVAIDKAIEQTETIDSFALFKVTTEVPANEPEIVPNIQEKEECPVTQNDAGKQDNSTVAENICEEPVVESIPEPTHQEVNESMHNPAVIESSIEVAVDKINKQTETIDSTAVFNITAEVPAIEPEIVPDIEEKQDNIYDPTSVESEKQIAFDGPEECPVIQSDAKNQDNSTLPENICEEPVVESILAPTNQEVNESMENPAVIESSIEVAVDEVTKQTETIDSSAVLIITTELPAIDPEIVPDIQAQHETITNATSVESGTQIPFDAPEECPVTQSDAEKPDNCTIPKSICEEPVLESIPAPTNQEVHDSMHNPAVIERAIEVAVHEVNKQTETIDSSAVLIITTEVPAIEPEIVPQIQAKYETITNPTSVESGTQITFDGPEECPVTQSDAEKQENSTVAENVCEEPVTESIPAPTHQQEIDSTDIVLVIQNAMQVAVDEEIEQTAVTDSSAVFKAPTEVPANEPEIVPDIQDKQETNDPISDESGAQKAGAEPEKWPVTKSDAGKQDNSIVAENIYKEQVAESIPAPTNQVNESMDNSAVTEISIQMAVDKAIEQTETMGSSTVFKVTTEVPANEPEIVPAIKEKQETINDSTSVESGTQIAFDGPEKCLLTQSDAENQDNSAVFKVTTEVPAKKPEIVPDIQENEECPVTQSNAGKQDNSTIKENICEKPVVQSILAPTNQEVSESMENPAVSESSIQVAIDKTIEQTETIGSSAVFKLTTEVPANEPEIVPEIQEKPETINDPTSAESGTEKAVAAPEECPVTQSDAQKQDNCTVAENICEEPVVKSILAPTNQEVNESMDIPVEIKSTIQVAADEGIEQKQTIDSSAIFKITTEVPANEPEIVPDIQEKPETINDPTSDENGTPKAVAGPEECPVTQSDAGKQDNSTVAENICEEAVVESISTPTIQQVNESMDIPVEIKSTFQVAVDEEIEQTETIDSCAVFKVTTEEPAIEPEIVPEIQEKSETINDPTLDESGTQKTVAGPEECPVTQSDAEKQDNSTVAGNICEEPVVEPIPAPTNQEVNESMENPGVIESSIQVAVDEQNEQPETIDSSAVFKVTTEVPANEPEIVPDIQEKPEIINDPTSDGSGTQKAVAWPEEFPVTQSDAEKQDNSTVAENICEEPVVEPIPAPNNQEVNESMENPGVIESSIQVAVDEQNEQPETIDSSAVFKVTTEVPANEPEIVPEIQEKPETINDPTSDESGTQKAVAAPEECPVTQSGAEKQDNCTVAENICEEPVVESILAPTNQEVNESMDIPVEIKSTIQVAADEGIEQKETIDGSTIFKVTTEVPANEPEIVPDIQEKPETINDPTSDESGTQKSVAGPEECPVTQSDAGKQDNSTVAENICEEAVVESISTPTIQQVNASMDIPVEIKSTIQVAVDEEIEQTERIDNCAVFKVTTEVPANEPEIVPDIQEKPETINDPTSDESGTQKDVAGPEECPVTQSDAGKQDNSTVAENICKEAVVESISTPTIQQVNESMDIPVEIKSTIQVAVDEEIEQTERIDSCAVFKVTTEVPANEPEIVPEIQEKPETINDPTSDESGTQKAVAAPEECPVTQSDAEKQNNCTVAENICEEPVVESILAPTNQEVNEAMDIPVEIKSTIQVAADEGIEQKQTIDGSTIFKVTTEVPANEPEIVPDIQEKPETINDPTSDESGTQKAVAGPEECPVTQSDAGKQDNSTVAENICEEAVVESISTPTIQQVNESMDIPVEIKSTIQVAVDEEIEQIERIDSCAVFKVTMEVPANEPEIVPDIQEKPEIINDPTSDGSGTQKAVAWPEECPVTQSDAEKQDNSTVAENICEEPVVEPIPAPTNQEVNESMENPGIIESSIQVAVDEQNEEPETIDSSAVFKVMTEVPANEQEIVPDIQEKPEIINDPTSDGSGTQKAFAWPEDCPVTQSDAGKPDSSTLPENICEEAVVESISTPTNQEVNESMDISVVIKSTIQVGLDEEIEQTETIDSSAVFKVATEVPAIEPEIVPDIHEKPETIDDPTLVKITTQKAIAGVEECPITHIGTAKQDNSTVAEAVTEEPVVVSIPVQAVGKVTTKQPSIDSEKVPDTKEKTETLNDPSSVQSEELITVDGAVEYPKTRSESETQDSSTLVKAIIDEPIMVSTIVPVIQEGYKSMDIFIPMESTIQVAVEKVPDSTKRAAADEPKINLLRLTEADTINNSAVSKAITVEPIDKPEYVIGRQEDKEFLNYPHTVGSESQTAVYKPKEYPEVPCEAESLHKCTISEASSEEPVVHAKVFPTSQEANKAIVDAEPKKAFTKASNGIEQQVLIEDSAKTECTIPDVASIATGPYQTEAFVQEDTETEILKVAHLSQQHQVNILKCATTPETPYRRIGISEALPVKEMNDPDISTNTAILRDEGERKLAAPVDNASSQKRLRRQHNVIDTTSSVDENQSETVTGLATLCQFHIKDKRLLAALENRRRRTLVMQRYLSSFDSGETPIDSRMPETTTIVSTTEEDIFHADHKSESENFLVGDRCQYNFDFINEILFSDQLSSDSNRTDDSPPTYIETYSMHTDRDETVGISASVLCNGTANTPTPTTNNTKYKLINEPPRSAVNGEDPEHLSNDLNGDDGVDDDGDDDDDSSLFRRFVPGSIAEREYMKWNNAVEMPNNPYAPEALKRRISGSQDRFIDLPNISPSTEQSPLAMLQSEKDERDTVERSRDDYKRYSRDYYINESKMDANSPKRHTSSEINISDDPSTDHITINEADKQKTADIDLAIYQATPAYVVEENASIETISNQSFQSVNTTTSDDSDTVRIYDFRKQETTILRSENATRQSTTETAASISVDSMDEHMGETQLPSERRDRPKDLALAASGSSSRICTPTTNRGSTPVAFKFMQPKRKLIDPSQVLSFDETEPQPPTPPGEKVVIEEDLVQVLPSVKALAQAFLQSASKRTPVERRWKATVKQARAVTDPCPKPPPTPTDAPKRHLEGSPSIAEIAEDATIASDLSSLETDPPTHKEDDAMDSSSQSVSPRRSAGGRYSFLRSNIAFFENLKFK